MCLTDSTELTPSIGRNILHGLRSGTGAVQPVEIGPSHTLTGKIPATFTATCAAVRAGKQALYLIDAGVFDNIEFFGCQIQNNRSQKSQETH